MKFNVPFLAGVNIATDDGRIFGELAWRDVPLSLYASLANVPGHDGAALVGSIDDITRDGDRLSAIIDINTTDEVGARVAELIQEEDLRGISVDVTPQGGVDENCVTVDDDGFCVEFEVTFEEGLIVGATIVGMPAFRDALIDPTPLDGGPVEGGEPAEPEAEAAAVEGCTDCDEAEAVAEGVRAGTPEVVAAAEAIRDERMRAGSTVVQSNGDQRTRPRAVLAAGFPDKPPASWFRDPQLSKPTALTVTDDGRVYGHIAPFAACHTGYPDTCIAPPRSASGLALFRVGETVCADGTRVPSGTLTVGGGHAPEGPGTDWRTTRAFYDDTSTGWADVAAGEDAHGIWVAGAVRPNVSADTLRTVRGSAPSGDWRKVGTALELIAIHCVNTPGFPVARGLAASGQLQYGELVSLVASGPPVRAGVNVGLESRLASLEAEVMLPRLDAVVASAHERVLAHLDAKVG